MTTKQSTYPKPPYDNYEEVFHHYCVPISSQNAFRAMERDGKIFKLITHKIKGLKYIYWHPEKNAIALWHKKNNVEAWVNTIHTLDERFVFAILRSNAPIKTNAKELEEECKQNETVDGDSEYDIVEIREHSISSEHSNVESDITDAINDLTVEMDISINLQSSTETEVGWALENLEHFKKRTTYKELFDIPDLSGTSPTYTFTPQLMEAMDSILTSCHLPRCQTLLYDKHTCSLIWLRRDCSSYEIYTHTQNASDYAKRFILNTIFQLIASGKVEPRHLTPITPQWVNAYHQLQCSQMRPKHQFRQKKCNVKGKNGTHSYQNRKNHKRQCLHS